MVSLGGQGVDDSREQELTREIIGAAIEVQLLTYLRLSRARVGLIINFNVPVLKDGIVRRVL